MKAELALTAILLTIAGCDPIIPAMETRTTENSKATVEILFRQDGCTVYRFTDNGHYNYFVKCVDSRTETTMYTVPVGNSLRYESVTTVEK